MNPTPTKTKPTPAVKTLEVQPFPDFGKLLTYREAVKSDTAIRRGIKNIPTVEQYKNMCRVYHQVYVPLCAKFGKLPVSSFFRSPTLNKAIGGASNSAHLYGAAIDIDCDGLGYPTNLELFNWIRANLKVDKLIKEAPHPITGVPQWVHIGLNPSGPDRNLAMQMRRVNGKTIYEYI